VAENGEEVKGSEVRSGSNIDLSGRRFAMRWIRVLFVVALMAVSSLASAQDSMKKGDKGWTDLEKQLADINDQWVCAHKYHKNHAQDCVDFKNQIWPDTFFEISRQGEVTDKQEMVKRQTATATAHPVSPGDAGPNPQDFKLMAVYGNVALATDHTVFKAADASGKIAVTDEATVLRMFVKVDGKWRPAGAALVPVK
jgi:hypothetical protein